MAYKVHLRSMVLFYPARQSREWVAHCLDYDLVGMGRTMRAAFTELVGTLEVYIQEWVAGGGTEPPPAPAPKRFWDAAKKAEELPALDIGDIRKWLDSHFPGRRPEGFDLPERCDAALITDRALVPAT